MTTKLPSADQHRPSTSPAGSPAAFEESVAAELRLRGYATEIRGGTNDWGLDILATNGQERVAVQVKMYRGSRPVNRRQIFELHGVAAYFDCSRALIATDGVLAEDAAAAARKLGVDVLDVSGLQRGSGDTADALVGGPLDFSWLWERRVIPLTGRTLTRPDGTSNVVVVADWSGIIRTSSGGNRQRIPIEVFRWAIGRILELGFVTRDEINREYEGRASSGIVLVLSQVPEFEPTTRPIGMRLRSGGPR